MEGHLKEINAVLGVVGSFVCLSDSSIAAKELPDKFDAASLETAARVATQTLNALETSSQRIIEVDLVYGEGRLILKNLRGGILAIVCARNINLPLLNLTANVVAKKLAAELKPVKPAEPAPQMAAPAPSSATSILATASDVSPCPLFVELEQETQRVIDTAKSSQIVLCAIDPTPVWQCCPQTRRLIAPPQKKQIDLAGRATQSTLITRLFERLGYQANQRFNEMYGSRRLNYHSPAREINVDVYLDAFEMYHTLDLTANLTRGETVLPETPTALIRLQLVEMTDSALSDLCALLLEHDLSVGPEKEKIDASQITQLCADEWGWFKTVSLNLDRLAAFAQAKLPPPEHSIVVERARRLKQSIEGAPKSLRWQTRARIGESMRWYETPLAVSSHHAGRPDMALG